MAYTKPIGVAFTDQDINGANVVLTDEQLGYTAEGQGTVTLNRPAGQITMNNASLGATTNVTFTLNNSYISANDVIVLNVNGGTTAAYNVYTSVLGAGSASITLRNITAGALSEAVVLNFALIHCA